MNSNTELRITGDGSHTLYLPDYSEHYHSVHGAIQESQHVFIKNGLQYATTLFPDINILEIGFGTGLNALLTYSYSFRHKINIQYTSLEPFPLDKKILKALNYHEILGFKTEQYNLICNCEWEKAIAFEANFSLFKTKSKVEDFSTNQKYSIIYFDAFAPRVQPELWTVAIFQKLYHYLAESGILVTYCAKGQVKRNLRQAGFFVETLQGPPGKREMIRAIKE